MLRYGLFYAFVYPRAGGHVTVSLELDSDLNAEIARMRPVIDALTP